MSKRHLIVLSLLVGFSIFVSNGLPDDISQTTKQLQELKKKADSIKKQKSGVLKQEKSLLDELKNIEKQISQKEKELEIQKHKLEQSEKELKTVENNLKRAKLNYENTLMMLNKRLRAMYMLGYQEKRLRYVSLIASEGDISEITNKYQYIISISTADKNLLDKAKAQKEELTYRKGLVEQKKQEIAKNKDDTEKARNEIENKKKARTDVLVKVQKSKAELTKAQMEIESSINRLERLIAQLRDDQERKDTGKKDINKKPYQNPSAGSMTNIMWPVRGQVIENAAPSMKGVTIKADYGTDIKCVKDGIVDYATWFDGVGYGQMIIINHGNGYRTLYAHASTILVKVGQTVSKGQVIGKVGDTGSLRGPMLYFEVWRGADALPTRPLLSD
ncbi:MAG: murein hydrolase activator EnvC family protein [Candidatus Poribacteria bacterium]